MKNVVGPEVVAHRGASGDAPELTIAAFELALDIGVDFIEIDARMSRDGEIVLVHDRRLNRTTNGRGPVYRRTLAELKQLDAGSWFNRTLPSKARLEFAGQKIPTLEEVVELVSGTRTGLYVELKDPDLFDTGFEDRIVSLLREKRFPNPFTLLSFHAPSLSKIKSIAPDVRTALLIDGLRGNPFAAARAARADELALRHTLLDESMVTGARAAGLQLSVWTADKERELGKLIDAGVDRITTNYPLRLITILRRRGLRRPVQ